MDGAKVLCASGSLGLTPFHEESFWAGIQRRPHAVAADAGSGDIGPYYLGSGDRYNSPDWEYHDVELMLRGAASVGAKVIIGSAGGAGRDCAVDIYFDIAADAIHRHGLGPLKVARIYSELNSDWLNERLSRTRPLGAPWELSRELVSSTTGIVSMIGVEPFLEALANGADVVLAGRSCDDAVFAALPISMGFDRALSLHMGKTIECGPLCATPILQREAVMGTVRETDFLVEPLHPGQRCTPASVAGHTLYERLDPYHQLGPGGELDLTASRFEAYSDRVVKVSGATWTTANAYEVKLEGSARVGIRRLALFGLRDPLSIDHIDDILAAIRAEVSRIVSGDGWELSFSVFGRDAILGPREPLRNSKAHEVLVLAEIIAASEEQARQIGKLVRYGALRVHYEGKLGTAGGAALPGDDLLTPDQDAYRWTIDHLLRLDSPLETSRITYEVV